jgi:large subunit ribosomal protein L19
LWYDFATYKGLQYPTSIKESIMGRNALIEAVEQAQLKKDIPSFRVGDTVKVNIRIVEEGGKERIQSFSGTCIARKGSGISETISLHRIAYGEGMERVIFLHSPLVVGIEVVRTGTARRGKLYYLRGTSGKSAKVKGRYAPTAKVETAETAEAEELAEKTPA